MKKIVALFFVLSFSLFLSACGADEEQIEDQVYIPTVEIQEIQPGIQNEFTATGEVTANQSTSITSEVRADVQSIFVTSGESVRKGQTLLRLQSASISSHLNTAGSSLKNAQQSNKQTQTSVEQNIEASRIALKNSEKNLENILRETKTQEKQAKEGLKSSVLGNELSISSTQTNLINALRNIDAPVRASLDAMDEILGVTETRERSNDQFEYLLGAMSSSSKTEAEAALEISYSDFYQLDESEEDSIKILFTVEDALKKTLTMLKNSGTGADFPQNTLDKHISSITANLSTIQGIISSIRSAQNSVENSKQQTSDNTSQVQEQAQANYETVLAQIESRIQAAQRQVDSARISLEVAEESANLSQVTANSSLTVAKGNYTQASISQSKLLIRAPFSGRVIEIIPKIGEEVNPGNLLIRLENDSVLKITTFLSHSEIQKIQEGDTVKIGEKSNDTIQIISPSADPLSKKHRVEILHKNKYLSPGTFVKLLFSTNKNTDDDRIFVPLTSIHILATEIFVWTVKDTTKERTHAQKTLIIIGKIEGEFVEVLSGLSSGDFIVGQGGRILEEDNTEVHIK